MNLLNPDPKRIIYVGEDEPFLKKAMKDINAAPWGVNVSYKIIKPSSYNHPNMCFKSLTGENADLFLLDYGRLEDVSLNFAKFIILEDSKNIMKVVGLAEYNFTEDQMLRAYTSGIRFNFIKGMETTNFIYTMGHLLYVKLVAPPNNAQVDRVGGKFTLDFPSKILEVTKTHIKVETSVELEEDSKYKLDFKLFSEKEEYELKVESAFRSNMRYELPYSYRFSTKSFDYMELLEGKEENNETYAETLKGKKKNPYEDMDKKEENQEEIEEDKVLNEATFEEFMEEYLENTQPMRDHNITNVLLFDSRLNILNTEEGYKLDIPYRIFLQKRPTQGLNILNKIRPAIIIFDASNISKNIVDKFYGIFESKLTTMKNYTPLFLIFGEKRTQKDLSHLLTYPRTLIRPVNGDIRLITQLLKVHHQKAMAEEEKYELPEVPTHIYFSPDDPLAKTYVKIPAKVISLTETIITFSCKIKMDPGTTFKTDWPTPCYVTTIVNIRGDAYVRDGAYEFLYTGVINGLNDTSISQVRRKVNEILSGRMAKAN